MEYTNGTPTRQSSIRLVDIDQVVGVISIITATLEEQTTTTTTTTTLHTTINHGADSQVFPFLPSNLHHHNSFVSVSNAAVALLPYTHHRLFGLIPNREGWICHDGESYGKVPFTGTLLGMSDDRRHADRLLGGSVVDRYENVVAKQVGW